MTGTKRDQHGLETIERCSQSCERILEQLSHVIVGQRNVLEFLLIAMISRGHVLLEGVPGLAKTLMVASLAKTLTLNFSRIQFTPDLMPADITGIDVIEEDRASGRREYRFLQGPLFANVILADEINRTPPKTQSALLEAMQEGHVTIGRERHELPEPFFVLATQNPLEQEGTYPLPEAQQDRFMFKIKVDYPSFDEELSIARRVTGVEKSEPVAVLDRNDLDLLRETAGSIPVGGHVLEYIVRLVRQTRPTDPTRPVALRDVLRFGAGPRAVGFLVQAIQARAVLYCRSHATCDDVQAVICPVLRHRLGLTFLAESQGRTPDEIVNLILENTPLPKEHGSNDGRFRKILST